MFDKVEIVVRAGDGGNGVVSFRREKFVPYGGPDGGDGGRGGDVVLLADLSVNDLRMYRMKRYHRAADGKDGAGKKKRGRSGDDMVLPVPVGTVVCNKTKAAGFIADLNEPGQQVLVAHGGRGGWGNTHYASSTNQAPRVAQSGEPGEEVGIVLELRLIADVGIIGYPSVGKSSLLAAATAARPKIASYPFTTREPILGVVATEQQSFIIAEIPGLIEGAHRGRGLGYEFLRHIVRTRMLIHLVDGSTSSPLKDMLRVNDELALFDPSLEHKPQLVVVNKIDLPEVRARLDEIKDSFSQVGIAVYFISAATGEGVSKLMVVTLEMLKSLNSQAKAILEVPKKVFRPQPKGASLSVHKEGNTYIVLADGLERIAAGVGGDSHEVLLQLKRRLAKMGGIRALEKAGVRPGDKIRCGSLEWEW